MYIASKYDSLSLPELRNLCSFIKLGVNAVSRDYSPSLHLEKGI